MRPIFTVHAGEYLVGEKIEESFKKLHVWIPAKDTGIDLLVTNGKCDRAIRVQVKFSKDFHSSNVRSAESSSLQAGGWWNFRMDKITSSPADLWVLVLYGFDKRSPHFIIIPPKELAKKYTEVFPKEDSIKSYLWVLQDKAQPERLSCWEARGAGSAATERILIGTYDDTKRDFSEYLENWAAFDKLNEET